MRSSTASEPQVICEVVYLCTLLKYERRLAERNASLSRSYSYQHAIAMRKSRALRIANRNIPAISRPSLETTGASYGAIIP